VTWKRLTTLGLLLMLCLACSGDTEAGLFRRRPRVAYRYSARGCAAPAPAVVPADKLFGVTQAGGEAGAFLAALNQWRAACGRGPVGWDATLAAYASRNSGFHSPGSSGGASQCWAQTGSLMRALGQWVDSPPHAAILLNAAVAVGASRCPSGMTCNAR
jgi:hypothetical protein